MRRRSGDDNNRANGTALFGAVGVGFLCLFVLYSFKFMVSQGSHDDGGGGDGDGDGDGEVFSVANGIPVKDLISKGNEVMGKVSRNQQSPVLESDSSWWMEKVGPIRIQDPANWMQGTQKLLDTMRQGKFSQHGEGWGWYDWTVKKSKSDALFHMKREDLLSCLRGKKFFFVGTSYLRTLYFDFLQLLVQRELWPEEKFIPSHKGVELIFGKSECSNAKRPLTMERDGETVHYCFVTKGPSCSVPGPAGVNLKACGLPRNRTEYIAAFDITLHYQFKTYLATPEFDDMIMHDLKTLGSHFDYLFLGSAEWGINKLLKEPLPHMKQAEMYYEKILDAFPGRKIFVYNKKYNNSTDTQYRYLTKHMASTGDGSIIVKTTREHIDDGRRSGVTPFGHGFQGPVSEAILHSVLTTMCADLQGKVDMFLGS